MEWNKKRRFIGGNKGGNTGCVFAEEEEEKKQRAQIRRIISITTECIHICPYVHKTYTERKTDRLAYTFAHNFIRSFACLVFVGYTQKEMPYFSN